MSDYWTHAMHLSELPLLSRITCVSSTSRIPMPSCEVCLWGHLLKLQPEFHRLEAFLGAMDPEFRMASSWIPWVVMVSEKIGDIRSKSKKSTRFCAKKETGMQISSIRNDLNLARPNTAPSAWRLSGQRKPSPKEVGGTPPWDILAGSILG